MKRLLTITLIIGIIVLFAGFVYGGAMVGVPYQDPTLEMIVRQNYHDKIAT